MKIKLKKIHISIDEIFVIVLFLFIFSNKFRNFILYYFICYLFIVLHELSHVIVAYFFGKKVHKLNITLCGVNVCFYKKCISKIYELLIYFAGPIFNLIMGIILKKYNFLYELNMTLFLVNLIPIFPLDGYNILKIIFDYIFSEKTTMKILKIINIVVVIIFAVYSVFSKNISYLIFLMYICIYGIIKR